MKTFQWENVSVLCFARFKQAFGLVLRSRKLVGEKYSVRVAFQHDEWTKQLKAEVLHNHLNIPDVQIQAFIQGELEKAAQ